MENNNDNRNNNYSFKIHEVIIMVAAACFLSFFAGSTIMELKMNRNLENTKTIKENIKDKSLRRFIDNYDYIIDNYYKDIDKEELINGAIEGMMGVLDDPYTIYMEDDTYNNFNIILNGSYNGIGIEIAQSTDDKIYIVGIIDNSPASEAGLMVGDIIIGLNGEDTSGYTASEFSNLVTNSDQKEFKIKVMRDDKEKEFTISKDNVNLESVVSKVYEVNNHKVGYIYISVFAINTVSQFSDQLKELEKEGIDCLIVDVRSNNGGHLSTAEKIASMFVDSSYTIYKTVKDGETTTYKSKGKTTKKYPIVALVDGRSASASELLVGCLKDNLNATVIGTTTYGKGTVQELITLTNGDQYKITTREWLTPNGTQVNGVGIAPDVEVKLSVSYFANPSDETDNQLQTALEYITK